MVEKETEGGGAKGEREEEEEEEEERVAVVVVCGRKRERGSWERRLKGVPWRRRWRGGTSAYGSPERSMGASEAAVMGGS